MLVLPALLLLAAPARTAERGPLVGEYQAVTETEADLRISLQEDGVAVYRLRHSGAGDPDRAEERTTARGSWQAEGAVLTVQLPTVEAGVRITYDIVNCLPYGEFGAPGCSFGLRPVPGQAVPRDWRWTLWHTRSFRPAQPGSPVAWPASELAAFLFTHLDLTTFGNSTGPRRRPGQRFFGDLGVVPTRSDGLRAISDAGEWFYSVEILSQRDYNGDGELEVAICFRDQALNGGTYRTSNAMVVQRYGDRVVPLRIAPGNDPAVAGCRPDPPEPDL